MPIMLRMQRAALPPGCQTDQRQEAYGNTAVSPDSWLRQLRSDAVVKMVEVLFTTQGR